VRFIILLMLSFIACSRFVPATPKLGIEVPDVSKPAVHIVKTKSESFYQISKWYTGDKNNAPIIAAYNNKSEESMLRVGDSVLIPEYLVRARKVHSPAIRSELRRKPNPMKENVQVNKEGEKKITKLQDKMVPKVSKNEMPSSNIVTAQQLHKPEDKSKINEEVTEDVASKKEQEKIKAQPSQSIEDLDEKRRKYLVELHEMLNKD